MKHLFFDCETFGQPVDDCAVIDFSFLVVDSDRFLTQPYNLRDIANVKRFKLSVKDQVDNYGWKVYKDTVQFWESQPEASRKHIKPTKEDLPVKQFTDDLLSYLTDFGKIDYWWSRSNTFDPVILWRIFNAVGKYHHMNEYLPYWRIRDIRTYIDAKLDFPKKNGFIPISDEDFWSKVFVEHDSSWNVLADALRMQAIVRAENDMEQVKR